MVIHPVPLLSEVMGEMDNNNLTLCGTTRRPKI